MVKYLYGILVGAFLLGSIHVMAQCPVGLLLSASPENPVCKGTNVTVTASTTAGGISNYIWVVNGDTVGSGASISTSINGAHIELYAVSDTCNSDTVYNDHYVVNTTLTAEYNVLVVECNQPVADIEILGITGSPISNPPFTYNLVTGDGELGQEALYKDIDVSAYPLLITDAAGCTDTTWIDMTVIECPPPMPAPWITPNDDGHNDLWYIHNLKFYPNNEVFIFDRWGQRVYHKKEYKNEEGWDVQYLGLDMPVSTYYYILKIKNEKSDDVVYKGAVSVFR